MMSKKLLVLLLVAGVAMLFGSTAIYAGKDVAATIKMETKEYTAHTKGIVEFSHEKHHAEYKLGCGECHHDADNKPLDLKAGDDVQRCIECHKIPGKAKPPKGEKWSDQQKREYHADAVHDNCIDCHKADNKKNNNKTAPTTCAKCHPKDK